MLLRKGWNKFLMTRIKTPATSANIGPGFDCFGLALQLFNTFDVAVANQTKLLGVEEYYNNDNNLFLQAYKKGCQSIGKYTPIHVTFHTGIPISRGLGSSATLIVAGLIAASAIHQNALSKEEIFQLASQMEGHPDNVAPCIYGGLTASIKNEDTFFTYPLTLSEDWKFTVFVPDFKVSTGKARRILPNAYPRQVAASNAAHASLMVEALRTGNLDLLKLAAKDQLHEPYRKTLIDEFDTLKEIVKPYGVLLISGSGSTCILISKENIHEEVKKKIFSLKHHWKIIPATICTSGTEVI